MENKLRTHKEYIDRLVELGYDEDDIRGLPLSDLATAFRVESAIQHDRRAAERMANSEVFTESDVQSFNQSYAVTLTEAIREGRFDDVIFEIAKACVDRRKVIEASS